MPKTYPIEFELKIKALYENNVAINKIIKECSCTPHYINKVRNLYNLKRNLYDIEYLTKTFGIVQKIPFVSSSKKKEYYYVTPCSVCKENKNLVISSLNKLLKRDAKYECDNCSNKGSNKVERTCKIAKRKSNTTGYIGVCVNQYQGKILGYVATLNYKGKIIMRNKYKDHELHEKTLIQGAVDRDIFIIEKDLPHTRNFTDEELLANIEYLGLSQVEDIKERLSNNKVKI